MEDGDNLAKFMGTLQQFNNERPIDVDLKRRIEDHFDYKWKNDKLLAFQEESDQNLFEQLPDNVVLNIYLQFLFEDFLEAFERVFSFRMEFN